MAKKKKEKALEYLQSPLPESAKSSGIIKLDWTALDKRNSLDSGAMSAECNISADDTPYIIPAKNWEIYFGKTEDTYTGHEITSDTFFDGFKNHKYQFYYVDNEGKDGENTVNGKLLDKSGDISWLFPYKEQLYIITPKRIMMRGGNNENDSDDHTYYYDIDVDMHEHGEGAVFNRFTGQIHDGVINQHLLFPKGNKKAFCFNLTGNYDSHGGFIFGIGAGGYDPIENNGKSIMPQTDYFINYNSRLFGVGNGFIYVSEYNDFSGWTLDTTETKAGNAWMSASQSNDAGLGDFTGITAYQGHVICFKKDSIQEIYGTSNPFRVVDVAYGEGCIDNRSIKEVKGLLFYASENGIMVYNGANPKCISDNLLLKDLKKAVAGGDGDNYYVYTESGDGSKHFYVYNVLYGRWSERALFFGESENETGKDFVPKQFAANDNGFYMLTQDNEVYHLSDNYNIDWSFETDFMTNKTVDIKHIKKIQMYAEVAEGADFNVYFLYDNEKFDSETSHLVYSSNGKTGNFPVRVKPRSTAHYGFKIHVQGHGYVKLYRAEISFTGGGELFG